MKWLKEARSLGDEKWAEEVSKKLGDELDKKLLEHAKKNLGWTEDKFFDFVV